MSEKEGAVIPLLPKTDVKYFFKTINRMHHKKISIKIRIPLNSLLSFSGRRACEIFFKKSKIRKYI